MAKENPFDKKSTHVKFDVLGRKVKGSQGNPAISKQKSIEARKSTLLQEYKGRDRVSKFSDKRIGEKDKNLSVEEKMVARFARERQRQMKKDKKSLFSLQDSTQLTHLGRHLGDMEHLDDEDLKPYNSSDEEENGQIDRETVKFEHFGGFDLPAPEGRKKTKSEVMREVMMKSKYFKQQRQQVKEENEGLCDELNDDFDSIREFLNFSAKTPSAPTQDPSYDVAVKELAFEKRAKPTDRLKTEEEEAREAREKLLKDEASRLQRMRGEVGGEGGKQKSADSLDDDFELERGGKRARLTLDDMLKSKGLKKREAEDGDSEEDSEGHSEGDSEGDSDDGESDEDVEEGDDQEEEEDYSEDDEEEDDEEEYSEDHEEKVTKETDDGKEKEIISALKLEIPSNHEGLLSAITKDSVQSCLDFLKKMETLYHPSLHQSNKNRLITLYTCFLDHIYYCLSDPDFNDPIQFINDMTPTLNSLSLKYPLACAEFFKKKIATDALSCSHFSLTLFLVNHLFSTSDFKHHIVSPLLLIMNQKLENMTFHTRFDIIHALSICDSFLAMQKEAKRYSPEVINTLFTILSMFDNSIHVLCPQKEDKLRVKTSGELAQKITLSHLFQLESLDNISDDAILSLFHDILIKAIQLYSDNSGFIEIFNDLANSMSNSRISGLLADAISSCASKRTPMQLQKHKPIPIQTLAPDFEFGYSLDRKYDKDSEIKKLRSQCKKEQKGALRELRKDNYFIAEEKGKERRAKDQEYKEKIKNIFSVLSKDQAESKKWSKKRK